MIRGGSRPVRAGHRVEKLSDFTDPDDRSTAFIFGDGAGAVVVGPSRDAGDRPDDLGLGRRPVGRHREQELLDRADATAPVEWPYLTMGPGGVPLGRLADGAGRAAGAGRGRRSPRPTSPRSSRTRPTCGSSTRWPSSSGCPRRGVARDIVDTGNTSAASIPLAMDRMLDEGEAASGGARPADRLRRRAGLRRPGRQLP